MKIVATLVFILISLLKASASDVKLGAFLDTYFAFDFNRPLNQERSFTTQPAKHDEISINLFHVDAEYLKDKFRGRVALQYGDSPRRNTINEPDFARHLQEAYVGYKISPSTWVDGGIYFGHIGAESFISKNNWTYSRALNLDYVPYYSTGMRVTHELSEKGHLQLHFINGWQRISDNNSAKALGLQYKRSVTDSFNFTYNNFFGDEEVVGDTRFRAYHNFIIEWSKSDQWQYLCAFDFGHQSQQKNNGIDGMYAATLTIRRVLNNTDSLATRFEYYNDRHQTTVTTETTNGFEVGNASVNFDKKILSDALWRTELRGFKARDNIFLKEKTGRSDWDTFLVTSLSLWI